MAGSRTQQLIMRGRAALAAGAFARALDDFDAAAERAPGYADVHNLRGCCLAGLQRMDEAIEAFDRAIAINEDYVEAHDNRARTLRSAGRSAEAEAAARRGAQAAQSQQQGGRYPALLAARLANMHAELGDLYSNSGCHVEAAEQYRRATAIRPAFIDIRNRLARTLIELGLLEAAMRELQTVLGQNASYTAARANLGLALCRAGLVEDARAQWQHCLLQQRVDDDGLEAQLVELYHELTASLQERAVVDPQTVAG